MSALSRVRHNRSTSCAYVPLARAVSVSQKMKSFALILFPLIQVAGCQVLSGDADPLCEPLKAFAASAEPGTAREFVFNTAWGGGFKGRQDSLYEKQCVHDGHAPTKAVCNYLMQYGAVEFAGNNVERAVSCLSPDTRFAENMNLGKAQFHFSYGTEDRGAIIDISFDEDTALNAMALRVTADGY